MWTYDIAREQCPDLQYLRDLCKMSLDNGYNAIGLYLEHRFAYPSAPWVAGTEVLTPDVISALQEEFPSLQIVPFINLLGHFEGFLYTREGAHFAKDKFKGMQADPANDEFQALCRSLIDDTVAIFKSDLIHIGGDETQQLGSTDEERSKVYADHFGPLAQYVVDKGRTPGVWGDMYFEHPEALNAMPKETIIFDWQYFKSPEYTSRLFREKGFRTVFCPTIFTYNSIWCHLPQSELNVREHAEAAARLAVEGVCVTTWECGLFGNYNTILPCIEASGQILASAEPGKDQAFPLENGTLSEDIAIYKQTEGSELFLKAFLKHGETDEEWARLMGCELPKLGGEWSFSGTRSSIKSRLFLYSNPFLLWLRNGNTILEGSPAAIELAERAQAFAKDSDQRGICQIVIKSVEFLVQVEKSNTAFSEGKFGEAVTCLSPTRQIFDELEKIAKATHINSCGSQADAFRCRAAKKHIEEVIYRIKQYGNGSLGYLPSFETLTHPKFVPHDQANWWLINTWANE
jgi:hypothetical protein